MKVETTYSEAYGAYVTEIQLKDESPIFVHVRRGRTYLPKPEEVYISQVRYLKFYSRMMPYGRIEDFDVLFSIDGNLHAIPVDVLFRRIWTTVDKDKVNEKILVPASILPEYKIFPQKK